MLIKYKEKKWSLSGSLVLRQFSFMSSSIIVFFLFPALCPCFWFLLNTLDTCVESPSGVVANILDYDIVVSEFEFQSLYYFHFRIITVGKGMNPLLSQLWVIHY